MKWAGKGNTFLSVKLISLIIFQLLVFNLDVFAIPPQEELSINILRDLIQTDAGIENLVLILDKNQSSIRATNLFYYYYINGIKSYVLQSDYYSADQYFRSAIAEAKINKNLEEEALAIEALISVNALYGDVPILVEYGSRLLKIGEEIDQPAISISGLFSLAWGHYYVYDDTEAFNYLEMAGIKALKWDLQTELAQYYTLLGDLAYSKKDYKTAKSNYEEAEKILNNLNPLIRRVRSLKLKNKIYPLLIDSIQGNDQEKTIEKFNNLIEGSSQYAKLNRELMVNIYSWKAELYKNYSMPNESIKYLEKSINLGIGMNHIKNGVDPYQRIKLSLAQSYYAIEEYQKSADLYIEQSKRWDNTDLIEKSESAISKVKHLNQQQLSERIDLLNSLKLMAEKKIQMQGKLLVTSILLIVFLVSGIIIIILEYKRIVDLKNTIYHQSITDSLTQVHNRRNIMTVIQQGLSPHHIISLIDIDDFKCINDTYGHVVGDEVIVGVVNTIKESLRPTDLIGRYGGEEFILILNDEESNSLELIEIIRKSVEEIKWPYPDLKTTISIGVMGNVELPPNQLLVEVDKLLYEAKKNGKNCIIHGIFPVN